MSSRKERLEKIISEIKNNGHRLTSQRIAIIKYLVESRTHPRAEDIYMAIRKDYPATSIATVYKTISLLKSYNEVIELEFSDKGSRFDGFSSSPHPHFICTGCGEITDAEIETDSIIKKIAENSDFLIQSHKLNFYGICSNCRKEQ
jgi:Fur family peroxide stress response transcriptional regulator